MDTEGYVKNMNACLFKDLVKKYDLLVTATLELRKSNPKCQKKKQKKKTKQNKTKKTKAGKERKLCIVEKIIEKLVLYMNTFKDVLPIFKSFGLAFEQKTSQIHKLHDAIIDTIHTFLVLFL